MIQIRVINLSNRRLDLGIGILLEPKKTVILPENIPSYVKLRIASFASVGVVKAFTEYTPDINTTESNTENNIENNTESNTENNTENNIENNTEETPKKSSRKK